MRERTAMEYSVTSAEIGLADRSHIDRVRKMALVLAREEGNAVTLSARLATCIS